jgi:alpha-L-fucosidase
VVEAGHFSEKKDKDFTNKDFRFTVKPGALYAIAMGWPGRRASIRSLATGAGIPAEQIASITMLGVDGDLPFEQDCSGLHVTMPDRRPCDHAYTLKIALKPS